MGDEDRAVDDPTPADCARGLAEARDLARKIVRGEGDPIRLANGIYWAGYMNGGFAYRDGEPVCPELNDVAAEFVQLTAAIHISKNFTEATQVAAAQIRKAAEAFLDGRPFRSDHNSPPS